MYVSLRHFAPAVEHTARIRTLARLVVATHHFVHCKCVDPYWAPYSIFSRLTEDQALCKDTVKKKQRVGASVAIKLCSHLSELYFKPTYANLNSSGLSKPLTVVESVITILMTACVTSGVLCRGSAAV
jgi:hypothetical protein